MATETLRPDSDISVECFYVGSGSHFANVDEATPSDADFNYSAGPTERQDTLGLSDSAVGQGVISNVSLRTRLSVDYADGGEYARPKIVVGGTPYYGAQRNAGAGLGEYPDDWATNPAGGSWTWAAVNALQIGYALKGGYIPPDPKGGGGGDSAAIVYQQYVEVTYTPAGHSQGYIIG